MYSHKKGNDKSERTAKGMKKKSHKDVKHEGLKNVSFNKKRVHRKWKPSRATIINLEFEINKESASCLDDKPYIHDNNITSYAYGH